MPQYNDRIYVEGDGQINNLVLPSLSQATTLNGTLNLNTTDPTSIVLTGTATGFSVVLPNATNEPQGHLHNIYNTTNQTVLLKNNSGITLATISQNSVCYTYLQTNGTQNGVWIIWQVLTGSVASGIVSYNVSSSTPFTTSSTTDVPITNFSVTPQAGTYGVWFNSDATCTQNNATVYHSVYRAGSVITDSIRRTQSVAANFIFQQSTITIAYFDGSQICDVRVRTNQGSHTVNGRSLLLIRLGN